MNNKHVILKQSIYRGGNVKHLQTKNFINAGMFAAVMAVLAQITIPLPSGIPVTLQTFAVALTAYTLSFGETAAAVIVYIMLGVCGLPVFSGFSGGIAKILGPTGGFIYGFLPFAMITAAGRFLPRVSGKFNIFPIVFGILGLFVCLLCGTVHFSAVTGTPPLAAFMTACVPYLVKDILSVAIACLAGEKIRSRLRAWR